MPDPILPGFVRTMAVFQGKSGLPEDRWVNNWIFRDDAGIMMDTAGAITRVLDAFYFGAAANAAKVSNYMPNNIIGVSYRHYHLGDTPPREPILTEPVDAPVFPSSNPLPEELAIRLSLRTADNGKRGRGGFYVGPLNVSALAYDAGRPIVDLTLRQTLSDRALMVLGTTENVTWCLLSQMDQQAKEVTGGYVDDAFDVQRRRGQAPVARTIWGSYTLAA